MYYLFIFTPDNCLMRNNSNTEIFLVCITERVSFKDQEHVASKIILSGQWDWKKNSYSVDLTFQQKDVGNKYVIK